MEKDLKKNSPYLVGGLGITGKALVEFFFKNEIPCVVYDDLADKAKEEFAKKYQNKTTEFYFGNLPDVVIAKCQTFLPSPGLPWSLPWIQKIKEKKIPFSGELELASTLLNGPIIAVTGTNGKSTTVTLIHQILKDLGFDSHLKGNIGEPLITSVPSPLIPLPQGEREITPSPPVGEGWGEGQAIYVTEVSSYQLETIQTFHPKISVLMNVTDDHLDRYPSLKEYAEAKARVAENQTSDDYFIYNADDPWCVKIASKVKAQKMPFSLVNPQKEGGFADKDHLVIRWKGKEDRYPLSEIMLKGLHNQENILASLLAVSALVRWCDGALVKSELSSASALAHHRTIALIQQTLSTFKGLKHRLEFVGEWKGMKFYDDSKGTNVGSVVMSLASFEKNVILILGGRDKGGDYSPLKGLINYKVKTLLLIGEAKEIINRALGKIKPTYLVLNMEEAIKKAFEVGGEGDTVLLSPACSSFDQYKNYAERGDDFKKWAGFFGALVR